MPKSRKEDLWRNNAFLLYYIWPCHSTEPLTRGSWNLQFFFYPSLIIITIYSVYFLIYVQKEEEKKDWKEIHQFKKRRKIEKKYINLRLFTPKLFPLRMKGHFLSPYPTDATNQISLKLALYCFRSYLKGYGRPTADDRQRTTTDVNL